jgi:hypothetical protein
MKSPWIKLVGMKRQGREGAGRGEWRGRFSASVHELYPGSGDTGIHEATYAFQSVQNNLWGGAALRKSYVPGGS